MNKCPVCGYEEPTIKCDWCHAPAEYEGWHRVLDFAGLPSGLIQRRNACSDHVKLFIGQKVSDETKTR